MRADIAVGRGMNRLALLLRRRPVVPPIAVDTAAALGLAALAVTETWPQFWPHPEALERYNYVVLMGPFITGLVTTLPLALRRRRPAAASLTVAGGAAAWTVIGNGELPAATFFSLMMAMFSAGAHVDRQRSRAVGAVLVGMVFVAGVALSIRNGQLELWSLFMVALFASVWLAGDATQGRALRTRELEALAARLERERDLEAERATAEERARIARELHDVIAHRLSVIVIQAAAAGRVLDAKPEAARASVEAIEATGREALAEMRRLLGVVRREDEPAPTAPQPGVEEIGGLVDEVRRAGLVVDFAIDGQPRPLPPGVGLSAYRVVQEALTNVLRHAGPARASVALRYLADAVEVEIVDDGRADPVPAGTRRRHGHGLAGMRERVELFDGTLEAGPRPEGGFGVRARLPIEPAVGVT